MCRQAQKVALMFLGAEINFPYYNFYFGGGVLHSKLGSECIRVMCRGQGGILF